jgi:hypothetical protein
MTASLLRSPRVLLLSSLLAAACSTTARPTQRPARSASTVTSVPVIPEAPAEGLYAPDDALRDVLSGPLEYLGTGPWPGTNRTQACAFRNQRVVVVNVYCTLSEAQAFRVDVYSPTRGRARVYAEAKAPLSARRRGDYFTFTAESEPAPGPGAPLPKLSLAMSFNQLRAYDEQRYNAYLPACYGGVELSRKRGGCLSTLAPRAGEWAARNRAFLERANDDWYRVVRDMRALASRYGREPD